MMGRWSSVRKRKYAMVPVECPDCHAVREVVAFMTRNPGYTGRCRKCAGKAMGPSRRGNRRKLESAREVMRELLAPCGAVIIPSATTESNSTLHNPFYMIWKGRCGDALECGVYQECLDMVANENWQGWKRKGVRSVRGDVVAWNGNEGGGLDRAIPCGLRGYWED